MYVVIDVASMGLAATRTDFEPKETTFGLSQARWSSTPEGFMTEMKDYNK